MIPRARTARTTRARGQTRVGGNVPMRPRIKPMATHNAIVGQGSANGTVKNPKASDGRKSARKEAMRIAPAVMIIWNGDQGKVSFHVTEYFRRNASKVRRASASPGRWRMSSYV